MLFVLGPLLYDLATDFWVSLGRAAGLVSKPARPS